ncbi:hypothetical protein H4S04_000500, partial [Coemansia sp. S16]
MRFHVLFAILGLLFTVCSSTYVCVLDDVKNKCVEDLMGKCRSLGTTFNIGQLKLAIAGYGTAFYADANCIYKVAEIAAGNPSGWYTFPGPIR